MLPKFIEECKRLLPDGAADSKKFIWLCAHCTCLSTMIIPGDRLIHKPTTWDEPGILLTRTLVTGDF